LVANKINRLKAKMISSRGHELVLLPCKRCQ
jgi:uncharacterized C2H2 Zn-finger protein